MLRSAGAPQEIADLIEASLDRVELGRGLGFNGLRVPQVVRFLLRAVRLRSPPRCRWMLVGGQDHDRLAECEADRSIADPGAHVIRNLDAQRNRTCEGGGRPSHAGLAEESRDAGRSEQEGAAATRSHILEDQGREALLYAVVLSDDADEDVEEEHREHQDGRIRQKHPQRVAMGAMGIEPVINIEKLFKITSLVRKALQDHAGAFVEVAIQLSEGVECIVRPQKPMKATMEAGPRPRAKRMMGRSSLDKDSEKFNSKIR
eukprot:CAMPEP_0177432074 /NCGR_PEP_ID=MMETSP0368-20130122/76508_1 /TAXON_ID=447022 ORGANISM="Scrippsiella hangoei-like, Strain SHHI-4" /NCGR_SAMPLE_ID=MMETSP0368 /ASSEMBLY_ACC=CAM_ASM_000363 /LENGTH=259 /DNA_ID=CAMNT_0018902735 /DNA_START=68 /DNA_END=845 /DNA_ORIENTATION=-